MIIKEMLTYLQLPRAKESDIYDFVINEAEAIKNDLPADANEKSRAIKAPLWQWKQGQLYMQVL